MAPPSCSDSSSDDSIEFGEPMQRTTSNQTALTAISAVQTDASVAQFPLAVEIDDTTAKLIIQLQLEDLEELAGNQKGKQAEGSQNDTQDAISTYRQELQQILMVLSDRSMARSIGQAVISDSRLLRVFKNQEDVAASDRQVALRAGGMAINEGPERLAIEAPPEDENLIRRLAVLNIVPGDHSMIACLACLEQNLHFDILELLCGHEYCRSCVIHMFERATEDEGSFPPRCCQEITAANAREFLSPELVQLYGHKGLEYSTPNRTYCSVQTCSTFIPPNQIDVDVGTCPHCEQQTCTICKAARHIGDCPEDLTHQSLIQVAQAQGWRQCYACHRMVEISIGCNHMM